MRCAIFGTGPRATHVVLAGDRVPAGTVLVTPDLDNYLKVHCFAIKNFEYRMQLEGFKRTPYQQNRFISKTK